LPGEVVVVSFEFGLESVAVVVAVVIVAVAELVAGYSAVPRVEAIGGAQERN
jgi:hypothetical protein